MVAQAIAARLAKEQAGMLAEETAAREYAKALAEAGAPTEGTPEGGEE